MSQKDKDFLISQGYILIKEDNKNSLYIFKNKEDINFNLLDIPHLLSNTLTF